MPVPAKTYPIFISYRRSDLSLEADWLYHLITTFFGAHSVFFDREEIEGGKRWDDTLRTCVSSANIVLILIGPKWLTAQLESGRRRLDDEDDWVRREVIAALDAYRINKEKRWIYTLLVNDSTLPPEDWLPGALSELSFFQSVNQLSFNIRNYAAAAYEIYNFISPLLTRLYKEESPESFSIKPFDPLLVPNPYELPDYQLPVELRLYRPEHPYKGLEYFKREDARIFFGRRRETGEVIDFLKKSYDIIRLYGQSGVGKSSFLNAGLLPRLEANGWKISYFRRSYTVPLNESLEQLFDEAMNFPDQDYMIIADQVEEVITNPNPGIKNELEQFALLLKKLGKINAERAKRIRLLLSYRKEYDVEIKSALREQMIISNEYWLKYLDAAAIKEAISGIMKDSSLAEEYHLAIEKDLEEIIAADLLVNDVNENVAPLLQMILRKMWDRVKENDIDKRIFSETLYESCKNSDLSDLLNERIAALAINQPLLRASQESGLVADILFFFVTPSDTSAEHDETAILQRYHNSFIKAILQELVDVYLLVRYEKNKYKLSHDSLAKVIRLLFAGSQLPGQRAAKLIDSKRADLENGLAVEFSRTDIEILEAGRAGMRDWTAEEVNAVNKSKSKIEEQDKTLVMLAEDARIKAQKAQSNFLTAESMIACNQKFDIVKATRLASYAVEIRASVPSLNNLYYCYDKAYAYPEGEPLRQTLLSPVWEEFIDLNHDHSCILVASANASNGIYAYRFESRDFKLLFKRDKKIDLLKCSSFDDSIFLYYSDDTAEVYNSRTGISCQLNLPEKPELVEFLDEGTIIYHCGPVIYTCLIADNAINEFFATENKELIYTFGLSANKEYAAIATRTKKLFFYDIQASKSGLIIEEHKNIFEAVMFISATEILAVDMFRGAWIIDIAKWSSIEVQQANPSGMIQGKMVSGFSEYGLYGITDTYEEDCIHIISRNNRFRLKVMQAVFDKLLIKNDGSCAVTLGHNGIIIWPLKRTIARLFSITDENSGFKLDHFPGRALAFKDNQIFLLDTERLSSDRIYGEEQDHGKIEKQFFSQHSNEVWLVKEDRTMVRIDLSAGDKYYHAIPFTAKIAHANADDELLIISDDQNNLHVLDIHKDSWSVCPKNQYIYKTAFSGDNRIAVAYGDGLVEIFSADNLYNPVYAFHKLTKGCMCLKWSPGKRYIFSGGWNSFGVLCDLEEKKFFKLQHAGWIYDAAFANGHPWIVTCGKDKMVRIFLLETGELLRTLQLAITPEQCLFSKDDGSVIIRNNGNECLEWQIPDETAIAGELAAMAIDDLTEEEKIDAGIVDNVVVNYTLDPMTAFKEELPPQINLEGISFVYE